jgi:cytidine deaminase
MRFSGPTNEELINNAASVINPRMVGDRLFGDVGCALTTRDGNLYLGVCIDTASGTGFCAEHSAIAAMVTAGEYRIEKIVAVWKDDNGITYALPPCGRCREFLRQVDEGNLDTDVILDRGKVSKLKDLLPSHEWPEPLA